MTIHMNYVNYDYGFFGFSENQDGTVLNYLNTFLNAHPEIIANRDAFYGKDGFLNGKNFDLDVMRAIGDPDNHYFYSPEELKERLSPEEFYQLMIDLKAFYDEASNTQNKEQMFCADTLLYGIYSPEIGRPGDSPARLVSVYSNNYFEARKYAQNGSHTISYDKFANNYFNKFAQEPPFNRDYFVQQVIADYKSGKRGADIQARIQKALDAGFDINEPLGVKGFQTSSLLYLATIYDDTDTMRFLIDHNADVQFKNADDRTPLFYVRSKEAVELLVSHDAAIEELDKNGLTPLTYLLKEKNPPASVTSALLAAGADPLYTDREGNIPLFYLSEKNTPEAAENRVIIQEATRTAMANNNYYNAFALSYAEGNKSIRQNVEAAIENGYDIYFQAYQANASGPTILHLAAQYGDVETIQLLQEHGMDINTLTGIGENALCYATTPEMMETLVKLGVDVNGGEVKPLVNAIEYGRDPQLTSKLIELGADINLTNSEGETALSIAESLAQEIAQSGETSVVKNTPQNVAIVQAEQHRLEEQRKYEYNKEVYEQLVSIYQEIATNPSYENSIKAQNILSKAVKNGFDVNFTLPGEKYNNTPLLHYAFQSTHNLEGMVCSDLLQAGADPKQTDGTGQTLLHKVTPEDSQTVTATLIHKYGLDINATDNNGVTPLLQIAQTYPEASTTINYFLKEGADSLMRDSQGKSALDYVRAQERTTETDKSALRLTQAIISQGPVAGNKDEYNRNVYELLVPLYEQGNFNISMLDEAIEKGFDINFTTSTYNNTPLFHYVFQSEQSKTSPLCQIFTGRGADPKQADGSGQTLLHKVSDFQDFEQLIQYYKLDPNVQDNNGVTPLMQLVHSHPEQSECAVNFVKNWNANPLLTDNNGKTALDYAQETPEIPEQTLTALTEATNKAKAEELQRMAESEETRSIHDRAAARKEMQARELMARQEQGIELTADEQRLVDQYKRVLAQRKANQSLASTDTPSEPSATQDAATLAEAQSFLDAEVARREARAQELMAQEEQGIVLEGEDAQLVQQYREILHQRTLAQENTGAQSEAAATGTDETALAQQETATETAKPITIRHHYGETLQDHERIVAHATERNKRIKTSERNMALRNIQRMEELGLIAKGPNGTSTADVRLYQLYQCKLLVSPSDSLQMETEDGVENLRASDILTDEKGRSHQQVYKLLTTKELSDEELAEMTDVLYYTEFVINDKGNVVNEGARKKKQPAMLVMDIEEHPIGDEIVYNPYEETEEEEQETAIAQAEQETTQETSVATVEAPVIPKAEQETQPEAVVATVETPTATAQADIPDPNPAEQTVAQADIPDPNPAEQAVAQADIPDPNPTEQAVAQAENDKETRGKITTRHYYGATLEDHNQIVSRAVERNKRIKPSERRDQALRNIQRMEELGLIAKGPNGTSTADVRLYQLYQCKELLSKEDVLQIELDGTVERIPVRDILTDDKGRSPQQVYKLLTKEDLTDDELRELAGMMGCVELVINEKGDVANAGRRKKKPLMAVTEIEEISNEDEIAFQPQNGRLQKAITHNTSSLNKSLSQAQNRGENTGEQPALNQTLATASTPQSGVYHEEEYNETLYKNNERIIS